MERSEKPECASLDPELQGYSPQSFAFRKVILHRNRSKRSDLQKDCVTRLDWEATSDQNTSRFQTHSLGKRDRYAFRYTAGS
jgi:hypothetical protein